MLLVLAQLYAVESDGATAEAEELTLLEPAGVDAALAEAVRLSLVSRETHRQARAEGATQADGARVDRWFSASYD
jgi:hypothetical protein